MLTNVCYHNGISIRQFTNSFNNSLWLNHTLFLIIRTNAVLVFSDFFNPFFSIVMNCRFRQQHLQGLLSISNYRNICTDNLANLGWININVSNLCILSEGLRISCQAIIETTTNTNHKVCFRHSNISCERPMHTSHSKEEWMSRCNRTLSQKTGYHWNLIAFCKFI